ncbi:hypothetical protein ABTH26_20065, partial [Acinetobacter baumannii]
PALDIVAEQFDWRGLKLGRLEVLAENQRDGARDGAREGAAPRLWRLSRLELTTPHARLSATGAWLPAARTGSGSGAARRHTELDFTLEL